MHDPTALRAAVNDYVERFNAADKHHWLDLFAEDAVLEDPVGGEIHQGRRSIGDFWDFTHSLSDAVRVELREPVKVSGSEVAFVLWVVATVGGTEMAVDLIEVQAFDEQGKITSLRAFWAMQDMVPVEG